MALNFHLFNCDNTYNLDRVEALISTVVARSKKGPANVNKKYFALPRMNDLCKELEEAGELPGYAVFVVHAHESRLSINEANAGIGYAKVYRTLQKVTDDRVLVVIGGDDDYKNQQERDSSVLSRWAWHKICSQFQEDYMNGVKSFIFSWDENHNPIHEEALQFYLDPTKTDQQFVPRPRPPPKTESTPKGYQVRTKQENSSLDELFPKKENAGRLLPSESSVPATSTEPVRHDIVHDHPLREKQTKQHSQSDPQPLKQGTSTSKEPKVSGGETLENQSPFASRRLLYKAVISRGRVVQADAYDWCPNSWPSWNEILEENKAQEKVEVHVWEENGTITANCKAIHVAPERVAVLTAIAEVSRKGNKPSFRVCSYLSRRERYDVMVNFVHHLDLTVDVNPRKIEPELVQHHIEANSPDYLVFFTEMEVVPNLTILMAVPQPLQSIIKDVDSHFVKGIILVLFGDTHYKDGELCSSFIQQTVKQLLQTTGILKPKRLVVMSCNEGLFIKHQDKLKELLKLPKNKSSEAARDVADTATLPYDHHGLPKSASYPESGADYIPHTSNSEHGSIYAPCRVDANQTTQASHGTERWLRYKAVIQHGRVVEPVLTCIPPDWKPDQFDLNLVYKDYQNEKEAILEFWVEKNGQTSPPVVVLEEKKWWQIKLPFISS